MSDDVHLPFATDDIRNRNARDPLCRDTVQAAMDLYLVSSAAAQLGVSGLDVSRSQWQGLFENTRRTRAVLEQHDVTGESSRFQTLRELVLACEEILAKRLPDGNCPPALWRRASRTGREMYECIEVSIAAVRDTDEGLA
jgi:hypothetical protein